MAAKVGGTVAAVAAVVRVANKTEDVAKGGGIDHSLPGCAEAEVLDIGRTGMIRAGSGSMGNKWFAETPRDAAAWGKKFFKWDQEPVWTVRVALPYSVADQLTRVPMLDGIGPARSAQGTALELINQHGRIGVLNGNVIP